MCQNPNPNPIRNRNQNQSQSYLPPFVSPDTAHMTLCITGRTKAKKRGWWVGGRGRVCDVGCVYARCVLELDGTWQTYILRPAAAVEIKFPARTLRNQIHQRGAVKWGRGMRGEICQKVWSVCQKKYKMGTKLPGSRDIETEVEDSPRQRTFSCIVK